MKRLDDMNPAERKSRIAKLLASPGTRAAVPDKYLPPEQRRQREMNRRLDAPIMPGSSMTGRQLARDREAAVTTQFGPDPVGRAQQEERDMGGWYDQYVRALGEHRRNVEGYQQQATQQVQGIGQALGGLGEQSAQGLSPEAADAARKASGVRQALTGSFGAMLAAQGANANTYADNLANVVAPGQRLAAQAQARQRTSDVRDKVGAFRRQFESEAKAGEAKNLMAAQALGLDIAKENNDAAAGRAQRREQRRHNQAVEGAKAADQARKDGAVNQYGYTDAQWRALPVAERQRIIKEFGKSNGRSQASGPKWLTPGEMGTGLSQLGPLRQYADKARRGESFVAGHKPQRKLDRAAAAKKIIANLEAPKHPVLITAALDAAYMGYLHQATVRKLIAAGYKPSQVAQTLGVPTATQRAKAGR